MEFWGRQRELARLRDELEQVRQSGQGKMLSVRGRRQAGKSRLLTELVESAGVPYLFTTAIRNGALVQQFEQVATDLRSSRHPLPGLDVAFASEPNSWADLFARLPLALGDEPAIVVLDEFPWATESDATLEGVLQQAWDRVIERLPVLLVLVGSDLAMMERLTQHDRALYGRAAEMTVSPLSPADVAEAIPGRRPALDLLDVFLVTGGYPRLVSAARRHRNAASFVRSELEDDQSALAVTGSRMLDAEFREELRARTVLEAIGSVEVGHATFSSAVERLGGDDRTTGTAVTRALPILAEDKRVVAIDLPVGAAPTSKLRRYRIVDPYLRFWFRYCAPHLTDMARGRSDLAIDRFVRDFPSWRGKAIEPVIQEAVSRLSRSDPQLSGLVTVGGWWNRTGDHEYDLVGAERNGEVTVVGTVEWRARRAVTVEELSRLSEARSVVPRAGGAKRAIVCPAGARAGVHPDVLLDAGDVLDAFR